MPGEMETTNSLNDHENFTEPGKISPLRYKLLQIF